MQRRGRKPSPKPNAKLQIDGSGNYIPDQRYAKSLLDNLAAMHEVTDEVFVDWDAARKH
ncbi:MAG: hypothetical protein NVS4B6_20030 [Mycobacterium sp.]